MTHVHELKHLKPCAEIAFPLTNGLILSEKKVLVSKFLMFILIFCFILVINLVSFSFLVILKTN